MHAWAPNQSTHSESRVFIQKLVKIKIVFKSILYKNVTGVVYDYYETNHD